MKIEDIVCALERFAPLPLQDSYDNAGLQVGLTDATATGALLCLDVTEDVVTEAIDRGYNIIVSHHPLIFKGYKQISGRDYIERCIIKAIKNDIVIFSAHTNLDNLPNGVNRRIADIIGLENVEILSPRTTLYEGEEVGAGMIGDLPTSLLGREFLEKIKEDFKVGALCYSGDLDKAVSRVAICGGAGAFLIDQAREKRADVFITGEIKYHDFFGKDDIILCSIGHYESEQYTQDLLKEYLEREFPELEIAKTTKNTNPIKYL